MSEMKHTPGSTYTDDQIETAIMGATFPNRLAEMLAYVYADRQRLQAEVEACRLLGKGFITAESCGPDRHYVLSIKFASFNDLQQAHSALMEVRK